MMEPGEANLVPRDSWLQLMKDFPEATVRLAQQLSRNYYTAYEANSHPRPRHLALGKICQDVAFLVDQAFAKRRLQPTQTYADPRGDWGDHRHRPRNREPPFLGIQEETAGTTQGATLVIRSRPAFGEDHPVIRGCRPLEDSPFSMRIQKTGNSLAWRTLRRG